jgi:hypothetical protein
MLLNFQNLSKSKRRNATGRSALALQIGLAEIQGRLPLVLDNIVCYKQLMRISFVPCADLTRESHYCMAARVAWTIIRNANAYVHALSLAAQTND